MDKGPDANVFLGIKVDRNSSVGILTIAQLALINRVLKELSRDDNNVKLYDTPANTILTKSDEDWERVQALNYRSAIGRLILLASYTRLDILFAVHQCAKFNSRPCTEDKEIILRPDGSNALNYFVDADFARMFTHKTTHEKGSVFSRTEYIIIYVSCLILCVSKM